jgi:hypothetical protein
MSEPAGVDVAFYRHWIVANGWAEAVGLGTTMALGWLIAPRLAGPQDVATVLAGALAAIALGIVLEGVMVGWAQGAVLQRRLRTLTLRSWLLATALGAGIAWALGMVPSTVMALRPMDPGAAPPAEPSALVQYPLAAALGLITGPVLGFAQWLVLRRHVKRAGRWLWANGLAWGVGMPLIFLGMDRVPWNGGSVAVIGTIYVVCAVTGTVVGAIHGRFLLALVRSPLAAT